MKDLGIMHYIYLGLEFWQKPGEIYLGHRKRVIKILQKFGMMGNMAYDDSYDYESKKIEFKV